MVVICSSCGVGLILVDGEYGSTSINGTVFEHKECKCDPEKGFKDDIPDTSSGVPMCECDPDLGP